MRDIAGVHMTMDGYVEKEASLEPGVVCQMFDALVLALSMRYLQRPVAMRVPVDPRKLDSEEDEGGWSVIAQITTSHIALHGWPLRLAFMLDVFSCKPFDTGQASAVVYGELGVTSAVTEVRHRRGPPAPYAVRWNGRFPSQP